MLLRKIYFLLLILFPIASLAACDNTGTFSPPPQLGLRITAISNPYPEPGEVVTISWDYDNPDLLEMQGFRAVSLLISGNLLQEQNGCLPTYQTGQACVSSDLRTVTIDFTGPITFFIDSLDTDGNLHIKAVKLRLAGMDFRLNQLEFTDPGYPNYTGSSGSTVIFDNAFGIYAYTAEDGVIDDLASKNLPGFDVHPLSQFFGLSHDAQIATHYDYRQGTNFPYIADEFYAQQGVERNWFQADGLIFAGVIGINGQVELIKSANGLDVEVFTVLPESPVEPFIVQIDLRSEDEQNGDSTIYFSDLHAGNPAQGLIYSAYFGDIDPLVQLGTMGTYGIQIWNPDAGNLGLLQSNGWIKDAAVGFEVVGKADGTTAINPRIGLSVEWRNILLLPDDELDEMLGPVIKVDWEVNQ